MSKRTWLIIACIALAAVPVARKASDALRRGRWEKRIQRLEAEAGAASARKGTEDTPLDDAGQNAYAELFRAYEDGTKEFPRDATIYRRWGHALMRDVQFFDQAEDKFRRATTVDPKYGPAYLDLARLFNARSDVRPEEVLDEFEKAAEYSPEEPFLYTDWGSYLAQVGKPAEAIEKFKEQLKRSPDDVVAYEVWARVAKDPSIYKKIFELHERSLASAAPDRRGEYLDEWTSALGRMVDDGMVEPAWENLQRARAKNPELSAKTWDSLVLKTHPKWGHPAGSPELANVSYFLGLMGADDPDVARQKKARESFAAYLKIRPDAPNAAQVRDRIRALNEKLRPPRKPLSAKEASDQKLDDMFGK